MKQKPKKVDCVVASKSLLHRFNLGYYQAGTQMALELNPSPKKAKYLLKTTSKKLENLYANPFIRLYWKGQLSTFAKLLGKEPSATQLIATNNNDKLNMKNKIATAIDAFGILLTALVAVAQEVNNSAPSTLKLLEDPEETALETPADKKVRLLAEKKAEALKAKKKAEADLLGEDEEVDEELEEETLAPVVITIEQLRAAGQAAISAGKSDKMRAVLKKHGSESLGGLDPSDYEEVLKALKKLA